jgi:hypothetical protein
MNDVYAKLEEAALYVERNPTLVKSITSFPLSSGHSDMEMVSEGVDIPVQAQARFVKGRCLNC